MSNMTETASKSSSEYTGLTGLAAWFITRWPEVIHPKVPKPYPKDPFMVYMFNIHLNLPWKINKWRYIYHTWILWNVMRIEYVTYIYHRFKLNANRYSISGASLQKKVDLRMSNKTTLPTKRRYPKFGMLFPHFSFRYKHYTLEKLTWNLKITTKNKMIKMVIFAWDAFDFESSESPLPPGWPVPIGIEDPEVAVTSAIDVPLRKKSRDRTPQVYCPWN